jgi:hypothetical protein
MENETIFFKKYNKKGNDYILIKRETYHQMEKYKKKIIFHETAKEMIFYCKYLQFKKDGSLPSEGCKLLNEILLENKSITRLDLSSNSNFLKNKKKDNFIALKGLETLKKSLIKNQNLKEIVLCGNH